MSHCSPSHSTCRLLHQNATAEEVTSPIPEHSEIGPLTDPCMQMHACKQLHAVRVNELSLCCPAKRRLFERQQHTVDMSHAPCSLRQRETCTEAAMDLTHVRSPQTPMSPPAAWGAPREHPFSRPASLGPPTKPASLDLQVSLAIRR